jgi:hypothetical protein
MNQKHLWIASLSGAVLTELVSNLWLLGLVNLLLCAGFWGSAIFSVWLYRRLAGAVSPSQGVKIGALTGLCAGALGILLSFAGLAGAQGFMNTASQFLQADALQEMQEIPAWAGWIFNTVGFIFNLVFGALGGWIGGLLFKPRAGAALLGEPA